MNALQRLKLAIHRHPELFKYRFQISFVNVLVDSSLEIRKNYSFLKQNISSYPPTPLGAQFIIQRGPCNQTVKVYMRIAGYILDNPCYFVNIITVLEASAYWILVRKVFLCQALG